MNPDDFQQAWQTQASQTRLTIDAERLLAELRRNQRHFTSTIFWRDVREVGTALVLAPLWIYLGLRFALPWTWYLTAPVLVWIAGFMLVDRKRHQRQPPQPGEPLRQAVENSLAQVEHQIWLLRNVFWWYLLPPGVSMAAFLVHVTWQKAEGWLDALSDVNVVIIVELIAVYYFVYWLNQRAVRTQLEPRRLELVALRMSLNDETPAPSG